MPADIRTSKIEMEKEFGVVLKSVVHDARRAAAAVDAYGRAIRRVDAAHVQANGSRRRALLSTRQLTHENRALTMTLASLQRAALRPAGADAALTSLLISTRGDRQQSRPRTRARVERTRRSAPAPRVSEQRIDFDTLGLINSWIGALGSGAEDIARTPASRLSPIGEAVRKIPRIGALGKALSLITAVTGPAIVGGKRLQDGIPTEESALAGVLNWLSDSLTIAGSAAVLAPYAAPFLGPALGGLALTLGAAATPLTVTGLVLGTGLYIGKRIYDKRQARERELDARLVERRRDLPKKTKTDLEKRARGRERRLAETYETLRMSNQSVVELTGKNVDDLLKGLQDFDPKAVELYFQSLREGRGEIAQLSQAQLAHLDLIEKLVVTYRALAAESGAARDAASEYANQIRPVDVIFETLEVHAGDLVSQFVGQREELHRSTQATKAQAQAVTELTAATTAQRRATEQTIKVEAVQNQNLRTTTQQHRAASEQIFHTTERLDDLTGALVTTNSGLDVHNDHVTAVTEAYRELGAQIGATIGAVLSGGVLFKDALESVGPEALDVLKDFGRRQVDTVLDSIKNLVRRLLHTIFTQLRGIVGSFGSAGGLLAPLGGGLGFVSGAAYGGTPPFFPPTTSTGSGVPTFTPGSLLTASGVFGGSLGGTALLDVFGFRPGIGSTVGGAVGSFAGSAFGTPAFTALLAGTPLAPLAPVLGPLLGTFFGTALGGLFGFQPTRIDTEKRDLRDWFRHVAPGFDYQRKERRVASGLGRARDAGLDVENAYLVAGLPYALQADDAGLGTVTRFRNIGVGGLGRSGASRDTARNTALRIAGQSGVGTTEGAIGYLNRALNGGFDRDPFTVAEVLENRNENAGETRHSRNRIVRLRDVVAGIIDIQTEFAGFVDSSRLAARILADETEQALRTAGRDASDYADVIDRIRDGSTHAAEGLKEIGGLDFSGEGSFTAALASVGRGVRKRIGNVGRGPLDSLLLSVRDLRRGLSDMIFSQLRGAIGPFRHSVGDSFLAFFFLTVPIIPNNGTPSRT